jgi:hypothetical protein
LAIEHILSSSSLTSGSRLPLSIISNAFLNLLKLYLGHCHSHMWKFLFQHYHILWFRIGAATYTFKHLYRLGVENLLASRKLPYVF